MRSNPNILHASAYATAASISSCLTTFALVTLATVIPGSTMTYPVEIDSSPSLAMMGAAATWPNVRKRGSVELTTLRKRTASISLLRESGGPPKWTAGSPEASLMAFAVPERFSAVTPLDPPTKNMSVPASLTVLAISPAFSTDCLLGSMRVACIVPFLILSSMYCLTIIVNHVLISVHRWDNRNMGLSYKKRARTHMRASLSEGPSIGRTARLRYGRVREHGLRAAGAVGRSIQACQAVSSDICGSVW